MNRCRVSYAVTALVLSIVHTPVFASDIQSPAANLPSVSAPTSAKTSPDAKNVSLESKAVAPTEEHRVIESYTVIDEVTHTPPKAGQEDKSETAQSFHAPAGALYTTSDDCG